MPTARLTTKTCVLFQQDVATDDVCDDDDDDDDDDHRDDHGDDHADDDVYSFLFHPHGNRRKHYKQCLPYPLLHASRLPQLRIAPAPAFAPSNAIN